MSPINPVARMSQFRVFTRRLLVLLAVINYGALLGSITKSIGYPYFNLDTECRSCQPHDWQAIVT